MKKTIFYSVLFAILAFTLVTCDSSDDGGGGGGTNTGPVAATGVTLSRSTMLIEVGSSDTLNANVLPPTSTNKNVSWSVSPSGIVTIPTSGNSITVNGDKVGTAIITVTTADGGFTAPCEVTVADYVPVTELTINEVDFDLPEGSTKQLSVSVVPSGASKTVTWKTSNSAIISVSNGLVKAEADTGTATITATSKSGESDTVKVTATAKSDDNTGDNGNTGNTGTPGIPATVLVLFDEDGTELKTANFPGQTGESDNPFIISDIFAGKTKKLTFTAAGPTGVDKRVDWKSYTTNYAIVESTTASSATLKGINVTGYIGPQTVLFSAVSYSNPSLYVFFKFDVKPPNPVTSMAPLAWKDPSTAKFFGNYLALASQTGLSTSAPIVLGTTATTNSGIITTVLEGDNSKLPENQDVICYTLPPAMDGTIEIGTIKSTPRTGTEFVDIEIPIKALKGSGGQDVIIVVSHPDVAERRFYVRVLQQYTGTPTITPSTAVTVPAAGQTFTVSYGDFPDSDVAQIEWDVLPRPAWTGYIEFNSTSSDNKITDTFAFSTPITAAEKKVLVESVLKMNTLPSQLKIEVRIWDFYASVTDLADPAKSKKVQSGLITTVTP